MQVQKSLDQTATDIVLTKDVQLVYQFCEDIAKLMPMFALGFPILVFEYNCYKNNLCCIKLEISSDFDDN